MSCLYTAFTPAPAPKPAPGAGVGLESGLQPVGGRLSPFFPGSIFGTIFGQLFGPLLTPK